MKANLGANGILTYIVKKEKKDVPSLEKAYELVETDMIECVNLMGVIVSLSVKKVN